MNLSKLTIITSLILLVSSSLYAEITVTKLQGNVAYRSGTSWLPLKDNQTLPEGVKISTGANSYAELKLNSINHTLKIKPLTVIQVFSKETAENTDTHIGLKRGGIVAKVPRNGNVKTVFKVSSPVATSSVRGTEEDISYGPGKGMEVKVLSGVIEGRNRLGRGNFISGLQKFVQKLNEPGSQNILNDVKTQSLIAVNGYGVTASELALLQFFGDDQIGSRDDEGAGILNQNTQKTRVRIIITAEK